VKKITNSAAGVDLAFTELPPTCDRG